MKVLVLAAWNWFYWRVNPAIKTVIVKDCKSEVLHHEGQKKQMGSSQR
jgi:hypothetical protein